MKYQDRPDVRRHIAKVANEMTDEKWIEGLERSKSLVKLCLGDASLDRESKVLNEIINGTKAIGSLGSILDDFINKIIFVLDLGVNSEPSFLPLLKFLDPARDHFIFVMDTIHETYAIYAYDLLFGDGELPDYSDPGKELSLPPDFPIPDRETIGTELLSYLVPFELRKSFSTNDHGRIHSRTTFELLRESLATKQESGPLS